MAFLTGFRGRRHTSGPSHSEPRSNVQPRQNRFILCQWYGGGVVCHYPDIMSTACQEAESCTGCCYLLCRSKGPAESSTNNNMDVIMV